MKVLAGAPSAEARVSKINGAPPRIEPLAESELSFDALEYCRNLRLAMGIPENGQIPEVRATMLRHPVLNEAQTDIGIMLNTKGTLINRERELAVLRQAWVTGSPYEWGEHVDIGKRLGLAPEEIERITQGVDDMLTGYRISDATWDVLAETWDDKQLQEFPILVGVNAATAMQQNSIHAALRANNPGLSHR